MPVGHGRRSQTGALGQAGLTTTRQGGRRATLLDLLADDDGEGGGRRRSVGKEAGSARRGREVGNGARRGGRRAALGEGGSRRGLVGGRRAVLRALFAFVVAVWQFWVSSSSILCDPNGEIGLSVWVGSLGDSPYYQFRL